MNDAVLTGKRVAMLVEDEFEDRELTGPLEALRAAGATVTLVGPRAGAEFKGKRGQAVVTSDLAAGAARMKDFEALVIPGGHAPDKMPYTLADARHLARLDAFDLLLIEQPLPEDDIRGHAQLARVVATPICLDESITSARAAADAIALGATSVVNVKPGRVGGYLEARRVHDVCAANGVPVWCGGMLETGLGRAANVALAALPNFTLPGDTSASDRYYARDITEPFVLRDGHVAVPTGPGLGVLPDPDALAEVTTATEWIPV